MKDLERQRQIEGVRAQLDAIDEEVTRAKADQRRRVRGAYFRMMICLVLSVLLLALYGLVAVIPIIVIWCAEASIQRHSRV